MARTEYGMSVTQQKKRESGADGSGMRGRERDGFIHGYVDSCVNRWVGGWDR